MKATFLLLTVFLCPINYILASNIVEVVPISNQILLVHFDDGLAIHHQLGQSRNNESIVDNPLNIADADNRINYLLSSSTHVFYTIPRQPDSLGRKTKPTEFTLPSYFPTGKDYVLEHWVYLFLPQALQSGASYTLATGNLATNGSSFNFTFSETNSVSEAIHLNIIGYSTLSTGKYGYLYYWLGNKGSMNLWHFVGKPFQLLNEVTGQVVFTDTIRFRSDSSNIENYQCDNGPNCNYLGATVFECNFSSFNTPGTYRLVVPGIGCSFPFEIGRDVYRQVYKKVAKGLYQQRSGIPLQAPYVTTPRPRPHHPLLTPGFKNKLQYTKWRVFDGSSTDANLNDTVQVLALAKGPIDVWGWYQDAGDWDSYFSHARVPQMMLHTYEVAPNNFAVSELNIQESGNNLPDFLDEARWQIRFYHRLRKALIDSGYGTGGVGGGRVLPDFGGEDAPGGTAIGSWQDTIRTWWVSGEEPWMTYKYAGLAAQFAYILQKYCYTDPEGINWRQEAIAAYNWAQINTRVGDEQSRFDDAYFLRNDRAYAAAALYRLTGQTPYHTQVLADLSWVQGNETLHYPNGDKQWGIFMYVLAGLEQGLNVDANIFQRCKDAVLGTTDFFMSYFNERSTRWRGNMWDPMLNGNQTTPKLFEPMMGIGLGRKLGMDSTVQANYRQKLYLSADYFLGSNSFNSTWISGLGERNPNQDIFQLDGWYNGTNTMTEGLIPYGGQRAYASTFAPFNALSPDYPYNCDNGCKIFPSNILDWPGHERWFNQRWAPNTCEYTIYQTLAPSLTLYAFLSDSVRSASCQQVLAANDIALYGTQLGSQAARLRWVTNIPANIISYQLQRSTNLTDFITVHTAAVTSGRTTYLYDDMGIPAGTAQAYYRIRYQLQNGEVQYSTTILVKLTGNNNVKVQPQPAGNQLQLTLYQPVSQRVQMLVTDVQGKPLLRLTQLTQPGQNTLLLNTQSLAQGLYLLQLRDATGKQLHSQTIQILR